MLCPRCMQREANVFFARNINGKKEEFRVCDICAKEIGLLSGAGVMVDINDFISDFVGKGIGDTISESNVCPTCGTTFAEFSKNSKFGCSMCYETFGAYLPPIMKRIHGNSEHTGKFPSRIGDAAIKKRQLDKLKDEIAKAVAIEDFESAAKLRDEIKSLTKEIEVGKEE